MSINLNLILKLQNIFKNFQNKYKYFCIFFYGDGLKMIIQNNSYINIFFLASTL